MKILGVLLFVIYLIWGIYKRFSKKEKTFEWYIKKGVDAETYFRFNKAFQIYKEAREIPYLTPNQKMILEFNCGICLLRLKKYKEAVTYFDRYFDGEPTLGPFHYRGHLKHVIKGYLFAGEHQKARRLYESLLKRSDYDPQFNKLKRLDHLIYRDANN